jgi:hypothetical protein
MRKVQYGVKFVGYAAYVVARGKYGRNVEYAMLDFVSGCVLMHADGGWVQVPKSADIEPFLKNLPKIENELQERCRCELSRRSPSPAEPTGAVEDMIQLSCGQNTVTVARGTKIKKVIRQIHTRYAEIQKVIEQAEEIGLRIKRRPYSEHIAEIAETGLSRVEVFGFAYFIDGKLIFQPDYQVSLVRQSETCPRSFEIQRLQSD